MGNIKIKRVQRNKKTPTAKEKILAGLGMASTLASTGAGLAKPSRQAIVNTTANGNSWGNKLKQDISNIFGETLGVPTAKADTVTFTVSGASLQAANNLFYDGNISLSEPLNINGSQFSSGPVSASTSSIYVNIGGQAIDATSVLSDAGINAVDVYNALKIQATQTPAIKQISISGSLSAAGKVGQAYYGSLTASNGNGNYTWTISGNLPAGLIFSNGNITGTPTQSGLFPITIVASDGVNTPGAMAASLSISAIQTQTITGLSYQDGRGNNISAVAYDQNGNASYTSIVLGTGLAGDTVFDVQYSYTAPGSSTPVTGTILNWQTGQSAAQNISSQNVPAGIYTITGIRINNPQNPNAPFVPVNASITINPYFPAVAAPVLNSAQGFNSATGNYESATGNAVSASDDFLVLYGSFADSGNTVNLNGQTLTLSPGQQTAAQLNAPLSGINFSGLSSLNVSVSNAGGASQSLAVQIIQPAQIVTISDSDATAFINNLYQTVLNRTPDPSDPGPAWWALQLQTLVSQSQNIQQSENSIQTSFIQAASAELASDAQGFIASANTTPFSNLNSYQQDALNTYLSNYLQTNSTSAIADQNFQTFTPGSIMAWSLGMGTSTTLNATAQALGFTQYDSVNNVFTKLPTGPSATQITISGSLPASGTIGQAYAGSLTAGNGNGNYIWTVSGHLPPGLSFNNGALSGTPSDSGIFNFTVMASDGINTPASQFFSLNISPAAITLTAQNASTTAYDPSLNSQINSQLQTAVVSLIQSGQVLVINGNSVTVYMYGWGNPNAGASQTTLGQTYVYDGSNWNLQSLNKVSISSADASDFIANLYQTVLNRTPDPSDPGPAWWALQLQTLVSQSQNIQQSENSIQTSFIQAASAELASDAQGFIASANTTPFSNLNSYQQDALNTYLSNYLQTNSTSAIADQNFQTFTPGSIMAWSLGMGTSTTLNATAQALGFTQYDAASNTFNKAPVAGQVSATSVDLSSDSLALTSGGPADNSVTATVNYSNGTSDHNVQVIGSGPVVASVAVDPTSGLVTVTPSANVVTTGTETFIFSAGTQSASLAVTVTPAASSLVLGSLTPENYQLTPVGSPVQLSNKNPNGSSNYTIDQFSVQYYFLPDGEPEAVFNYSGQGLANYANSTFVVRAGGTGLGQVQSDGSLKAVDLYYGDPGNLSLASLIQNITANMPKSQVLAPGVTFATPPGANFPGDTFLLTSAGAVPIPVTIATDTSGNIISMQNANFAYNTSGVNTYSWYMVGGGQIYTQVDQPTYYFTAPGILSPLALQNVFVSADSSGNPAQITAQINGSILNLNVAAAPASSASSVTVNAADLQIVNLNTSSDPTASSYLIVNKGSVLGVVSAAGANAYQYIIQNNLSGVLVTPLFGGNYQLAIGSGVTQKQIAFNNQGLVTSGTPYATQTDEQDGLAVLSALDGTTSIAFGSANPASATILNDVTLDKDGSGDILSATGTDNSGQTYSMVRIGTGWAKIPVGSDGKFPVSLPSLDIYGSDASGNPLGIVMTLTQVRITYADPDASGDAVDVQQIIGNGPISVAPSSGNTTFDFTDTAVTLTAGISNNINSVNAGNITIAQSSTNILPETGTPVYDIIYNGQVLQTVSESQATVWAYAQENNLSVNNLQLTSTVNGTDYYTLVYNLPGGFGTSASVVDGTAGQQVTDPNLLQQIYQNNSTNFSWTSIDQTQWDTMMLQLQIGQVLQVSNSNSPAPVFMASAGTATSLQNSLSAMLGKQGNSVTGFQMSLAGLQAWAQAAQAALNSPNGLSDQEQLFYDFMVQNNLITITGDSGSKTIQLSPNLQPGGLLVASDLNSADTMVHELNHMGYYNSDEQADDDYSTYINLDSIDPGQYNVRGFMSLYELLGRYDLTSYNTVTEAIAPTQESQMQPILAELYQAIQQKNSGTLDDQQFAVQFASILNQSDYGTKYTITGNYASDGGVIVLTASQQGENVTLSLNPTTGAIATNDGTITDVYTNIGDANASAYSFSDYNGQLTNVEISGQNQTKILVNILSNLKLDPDDLLDGDTAVTTSYNQMTDALNLKFNSQDDGVLGSYNLYTNGALIANNADGSVNVYSNTNNTNSAYFGFDSDPNNPGTLNLTKAIVGGQSFSDPNGFIIKTSVPGGGSMTINPNSGAPGALANLVNSGGSVSLQMGGPDGNIMNVSPGSDGASSVNWTTSDGDPLIELASPSGQQFYTKTVSQDGSVDYSQVDDQGDETGFTVSKSASGIIKVADDQGDSEVINPDGSGTTVTALQNTNGSSYVLTVKTNSAGAIISWSTNTGLSGDYNSYWNLYAAMTPTSENNAFLQPGFAENSFKQVSYADQSSNQSLTVTGIEIDGYEDDNNIHIPEGEEFDVPTATVTYSNGTTQTIQGSGEVDVDTPTLDNVPYQIVYTAGNVSTVLNVYVDAADGG